MEIIVIEGSEKQSQFKPNFIGVNDGFVIPAEAGYVFSCGKTIPKACGFEAATRPRDKKGDLKKQSQFAVGRNWHKVCCERRLWQNSGQWSRRKQSQLKPIKANLTLPH